MPTIQPYLEGEVTGSLIFDASLSHHHGEPIHLADSDSQSIELVVSCLAGSIQLLSTTLSLPCSSFEATFPLQLLTPSLTPYSLHCTATTLKQTFHSSLEDLRLLPPNPWGGSTTRMDRRTGAVLVRAPGDSAWSPIIPVGFYTSYDDYLALDLGVLDRMKAAGCVRLPSRSPTSAG